MSETSISVKAVEALTPKEADAYRRYLDSGKPPLAASTAAGFFELFLRGHSCEEIARMNPSFGLGLIVRARIDYGWDLQRIEHVQRLMDEVRAVVQNAQLESVQFLAVGMAAYQRLAGDKFKKFIQTGNPADLGEFKDMSFRQYKEMQELFMKMTGAEPAKKVSGVVEHRHMVAPESGVVVSPRVDRPMSSSEADDFLKRLDVPKKKGN